jgi:cysteine-rich repeat protein
MKRIVFITTCLFMGLMGARMASAVDLTCSVPAANVPRAVALCEELRLVFHVRATEWDNSVCASQFLRLGLLEGEKQSTRRLFLTTVAETVGAAADEFVLTWPAPIGAFCGDSIVDTEFGEECDDGNQSGGDGCTRCAID